MKNRHHVHRYLYLPAICILAASLLLPGCNGNGKETAVTPEEEVAVTPEKGEKETLPSSSFAQDYEGLLPPELARDFYPGELTREELLTYLSQARTVTGEVSESETWEGIIRITGDFWIRPEVTLTVKPGTIIFISALSDDQMTGKEAPKDGFNPKKPACDAVYTQNRVEIQIEGSLIARGTRDKPIIITSDAVSPGTDDWLGLQFHPDSTGEMERVIIEYNRILGISSSKVNIKQTILRNMMEAIVIMGNSEELLDVSPVITQSYIYNIGQTAITVRSGAPTISHNVIRARQDHEDLNLPGFEYCGIGIDHPAKPVIHHNFIEGGPPVPYNEYDRENYCEFIESYALVCHASIAPISISYNTFYKASRAGLEIFPSPLTIEYNNFIDNKTNLVVQESLYEPFDVWQQELFDKGIIKSLRAESIPAANNCWGSTSEQEITKSMQTSGLAEIQFRPIKNSFIEEALPDWREFPWQ